MPGSSLVCFSPTAWEGAHQAPLLVPSPAPLLVERREDADGQLRRTAAVDQLEQPVQIDRAARGQAGRELPVKPTERSRSVRQATTEPDRGCSVAESSDPFRILPFATGLLGFLLGRKGAIDVIRKRPRGIEPRADVDTVEFIRDVTFKMCDRDFDLDLVESTYSDDSYITGTARPATSPAISRAGASTASSTRASTDRSSTSCSRSTIAWSWRTRLGCTATTGPPSGWR